MFPRAFLFLVLVLVGAVRADELTRSAQNALKEQGFFYGDVTGVNGPETAAAIKRYQIRNGLEVTGTLTRETMESLSLSGTPAPAPEPAPAKPSAPIEPAPRKALPPPPVERESRPPTDLRRERSVEKSDRDYLDRQPGVPPPPVDPPTQRPPSVPPNRVAPGPYGQLFAQTPYATAPFEVQTGTIRLAQKKLRELGFYHSDADGRPGPALEEGLLSYQRFLGLPLSGTLDLETLTNLRLLPGRGGAPSRAAKPQVRTVPGQPLRGVWVQ